MSLRRRNPLGLDAPGSDTFNLGRSARHQRAAQRASEGVVPSAVTGEKPSWRFSMDKPLLGQRAGELLNILETLDAGQAGKKSAGFHLVGVGPSGAVVLHAALLDERGLIKKVTLQNALVSWSNVVERGLSRNQLSSVLPGACVL